MSESKSKHRMSAIQRDILFALFHFSRKTDALIAVSDLRKVLNKSRSVELQVSNFSVSCKTLHRRGFLIKYRDKATLRVLYKLTDKGLSEAEREYTERMKTLE